MSADSIHKDSGLEDPYDSLAYAKEMLEVLKLATKVEARAKAVAPNKEWGKYNVRFTTSTQTQIWFSGLNIGYLGDGPKAFVQILRMIHWILNDQVIYINEELEVTRTPLEDPDTE